MHNRAQSLINSSGLCLVKMSVPVYDSKFGNNASIKIGRIDKKKFNHRRAVFAVDETTGDIKDEHEDVYAIDQHLL